MFFGVWSFKVPPSIIGFDKTMVLVALFFISEWISRHKEHPLERLHERFNRPVRWMIYYSILVLLAWFAGHQQQFIYFQF
jgi:hypothetical protein